MSTSVSSTSPSSTTSATAASSTAALSMNENDFLNLLVTQLRYQNPLDPTNAAGSLVKSIAGTGDTTENIVKWDGTLSDGTVAPSGSYTFSITATDSSGNAVTATPYVYGTVTAVRYKSSGTVFVIDGTEVSLANVLEIMEE